MSSRDDRNRVWVLIPAMAGSWGGERDGQSDWWEAKEEEREDGSDDNVMDELQQNGKRRHHSSFPREQTSALEISSTTPFIHLRQTVINGHVMLAQICSVDYYLNESWNEWQGPKPPGVIRIRKLTAQIIIICMVQSICLDLCFFCKRHYGLLVPLTGGSLAVRGSKVTCLPGKYVHSCPAKWICSFTQHHK